jgi:hypothetical protein
MDSALLQRDDVRVECQLDDIAVNGADKLLVDVVMMEAVPLGQFDPVFLYSLDGSDDGSVLPNHLHMLSDVHS